MASIDRDLVTRALAGERQAFGDLVERYERLVHGLLLETVRSPEEAADLVQEVFCRAYEGLASLREPSRFGAWVARMAANAGIESLRRRHLESWHACEARRLLPLPPRSPESLFEEQETSHYLWAALRCAACGESRAVAFSCKKRGYAVHLNMRSTNGVSLPGLSASRGKRVPV